MNTTTLKFAFNQVTEPANYIVQICYNNFISTGCNSLQRQPKINFGMCTICRHYVCNAVAEQYPGYTSEEILSYKQYFWNTVRGVNDEILSR